MSKYKKLILLSILFFGIFGWAKISLAADHYIRPDASGANNGSDFINAWTSLPSSLTRGDTYIIAGGIYTNSHNFNDAENGMTYVYIRKANATQDSGVAGWNASYGTVQAVFSSTSQNQWTFSTGYYDINGVTPLNKWQTTGYGFKLTPGNVNQNSGLVTFGGAGNNIIIRRVEFANQGSGYDYAQYGIGEGTGANVTLQYCYFHDNQNHIRFSAGDDWLVEYCYFGPNISTDAHHGEGFAYVYGTSVFRYNYVNGADVGTGCHVSLGNTGTFTGLEFYGNIYINMSNGGNALFGSGNSSDMETLTGWKIYNNTFIDSAKVRIGCGTFGSPNRCSGWLIRNNLFYNSTADYMDAANKPETSTYSNNYYNSSAYGWTIGVHDTASGEAVASLFTSYAGDDYHLVSGSQAIGAGTTLDAPYNTDADGVIRSIPLDIGAFEYQSGSDTTPPAAPQGLFVQ